MDDLTAGLKGLNKSLLEARDPVSDSAAAFKALGLNVKELQAMDPGKAFEAIATQFTKYADGAQKAAVANQVFGKQAQVLIPLLDGGAEGIAKARAEAEKLGLIVSGSTAQAMSDLNDDLTRIGNLTKGAAAVMATELQPAITEVARILAEAATEGTVWNQMLTSITWSCKQAMSVIIGLTGTISAFSRVTTALGQALNQPASLEGMKNAASLVSNAWNQARDDLSKVHDAQLRVTASASQSQKAIAAEAEAGRKIDGRPVLQFTQNLDANAAAAKKAKKEVDEYAKMLESLQDQYRKLAAEGDPMKELTTDPKYQAMAKWQQDNLRAQVQANEDLKRAIDARTQAQENANNEDARQFQDAAAKMKAEQDHIDAIWAFADAQSRAVDPTIAYKETIDQLNEALADGAILPDNYSKAVTKAADDLKKAQNKIDPMEASLKSLQQAIEGFGKQSSDAMVDFVFATKDVSVSFGQMISSILKDLAKMLVYQNVMKPLFGMISGGVTGGGWTWGGTGNLMSATPRMSGGPVFPGQLYEVNELPGRREYFIPNVPGKIATDAGASGMPSVTVNVHMHKDDSATQDTKATNEQAAELGNRIAAVCRQVLVSEKRSGGILAPAAAR
ncbi:hypothetical protein [Caballeronia sp. LZ035]|uniref:hypothetical protein n=1 Tax=Caballeronia sp. LZ035 TaxID=3038568 RepID=UPI002854987E|nr:hypothetical protein [Caballeronia sp. LZ035]MDR5757907.1 hypothetical protein [Caballeronia sp. LZ035]